VAVRPSTVLSLCAGYGGLELGVRLAIPGIRCVGAIERQAFAAAVLASRMVEGALDPCPIHDDLESFDGRAYRDRVDLVVAGFPCQGASVAGKRRGVDDERWLWPQVWRVTQETNACWIFAENVPGLLSVNGGAAFEGILRDLASCGWDAEWDCVPAAAVGAPHLRDRVFLLAADASRVGVRLEPERDQRQGGANERPSAGHPSLGTAARTGMMPTPRASDATKGSRSVPTRVGREGVTLVEAANMGMLPTPVARDHKGPGRAGQLPTLLTPTTRPNNHRSGHRRHSEDEPGRTLLDEVRGLLPTPTAGDAKASGVAANRTPDSGRHSGATLTDVVVRGIDIPTSPESMTSGEPTGTGATRLNPAFVAWMMGLPAGWATIKPMPRPSTYSATASSRTRRQPPSLPSSGGSTQLSLAIPPDPLATGK
jgi:site-specific DNA-cytosine methylase